MRTKSYKIYCGDRHLTTIDAKSAREATIYICGILEGWRFCDGGDAMRKKGVTVVDEQGRIIFQRSYNY